MFHRAILIFTILIVLINISNGFVDFGNEGVFGKLKSGFEIARKLLGLDRASGVAQLVSDAFARNPRSSQKGDTADFNNNIFSGFLRVLGLDTKRIGAMAVNAIIFMAQLISTSLSKAPPPHITHGRSLKDGTPLDWMLQNKGIQEMLAHAKEENLPHQIIQHLKDDHNDENGCIQLLVCKGAPFIWGMQKAINAKGKDIKVGISALRDYIPSMNEVADNGDECETRYPTCIIHY